MIGCLPTQALAFLAVFVYATHATQAIAFEWKPDFSYVIANTISSNSKTSCILGRDFTDVSRNTSALTTDFKRLSRSTARGFH